MSRDHVKHNVIMSISSLIVLALLLKTLCLWKFLVGKRLKIRRMCRLLGVSVRHGGLKVTESKKRFGDIIS